jgi:signal transduction histidine kinase
MLSRPSRRPSATQIAWTLAGLALLLAGLCEAIGFLTPAAVLPAGIWPPVYDVELVLVTAAFAGIGALVVTRHPRNAVGWICLAIALVGVGNALLIRYSLLAVFDPGATLPGGLWAAWAVQWAWIPFEGLIVAFLPSLFPDGRLLSPRWQLGLWLIVAGNLLTVAAGVFYPRIGLWTPGVSCVWGPAIPGPCYAFTNPLPIRVPQWLLDADIPGSGVIASAGLAVSAASLIARFRKGSNEVRAQLKWLMSAIALCVASIAGMFVLGNLLHISVPPLWYLAMATFVGIPVSIGFAVTKYRLYDIDIVINKSLVFGALALFITSVYVAVVVGAGTLIGIGKAPNLGLSIVATAIVAVSFQPIRQWLQRFANRLVYGQRATPYEAISAFSNRMAGVVSIDDVLPRLAEAAASSVGGLRGQVRTFLADGTAKSASWPEGWTGRGTGIALPIIYGEDQLGDVTVIKSLDQPLTSSDRKLLADLAAQAGLVLHNVRLAFELQQRIQESSAKAAAIRVSRQRIVAAQDTERHRLEASIRSGPEAELVAMRSELDRVARSLVPDPPAAAALLDALTTRASTMLEALRDLARGIYPPLLRDRGLAAALTAQVDKMRMAAELAIGSVARLPSEVESAIYFTCVEALRSAAGPATVQIAATDSGLEFSVTAPSLPLEGSFRDIEDRIEALGGSVWLGPGELRGRLPIRILEHAV